MQMDWKEELTIAGVRSRAIVPVVEAIRQKIISSVE